MFRSGYLSYRSAGRARRQANVVGRLGDAMPAFRFVVDSGAGDQRAELRRRRAVISAG